MSYTISFFQMNPILDREGDKDILTSVMSSNVEDIQCTLLDNININSDNKCVAENNNEQLCSNGKYININHYKIII